MSNNLLRELDRLNQTVDTLNNRNAALEKLANSKSDWLTYDWKKIAREALEEKK